MRIRRHRLRHRRHHPRRRRHLGRRLAIRAETAIRYESALAGVYASAYSTEMAYYQAIKTARIAANATVTAAQISANALLERADKEAQASIDLANLNAKLNMEQLEWGKQYEEYLHQRSLAEDLLGLNEKGKDGEQTVTDAARNTASTILDNGMQLILGGSNGLGMLQAMGNIIDLALPGFNSNFLAATTGGTASSGNGFLNKLVEASQGPMEQLMSNGNATGTSTGTPSSPSAPSSTPTTGKNPEYGGGILGLSGGLGELGYYTNNIEMKRFIGSMGFQWKSELDSYNILGF